MRGRQRRVGEGEVDIPFLQLLLLLLNGGVKKLIAYIRMGVGEGDEILAQKVVGAYMRDAEAQRADGTLAEGLHRERQLVLCGAKAARLLQKGFTCLCQLDVALATLHFQKLYAVGLFERFNLSAERWLDNIQLLGSGADAACFDNGDEVAVESEIHSKDSF